MPRGKYLFMLQSLQWSKVQRDLPVLLLGLPRLPRWERICLLILRCQRCGNSGRRTALCPKGTWRRFIVECTKLRMYCRQTLIPSPFPSPLSLERRGQGISNIVVLISVYNLSFLTHFKVMNFMLRMGWVIHLWHSVHFILSIPTVVMFMLTPKMCIFVKHMVKGKIAVGCHLKEIGFRPLLFMNRN